MRARPGHYALASTVVALAIFSPAPAAAGGWDSLSFPRDHYLVGQVATTTDVFYAGELEAAGPIDGRAYYAYLLPRRAAESGFAMIDPPTIPEGAIRLGVLEISEPFEPERYVGRYARATLTFTVPEVPTGDYAIGFCDDPCEHGYVGWLAWGRIRIVQTEVEGRLLAALDREQIREYRMRHDLRQATRNAEELRAELAESSTSLRLEPREDATTPPERIVTVPAEDIERNVALPFAFLVVGALLGLTAGVTIARRHRGPAFVIPDTIPDDLELRELELRR
jgi:hypothetical protein